MTLAQDYLYCIEEEYRLGKQKRLSRISVQWGKYSRGMNIAIRKLVETNHPETEQLQIIYSIWMMYSILLEFHYKYPANYRKKQKKRSTIRMIRELRKEIINE